MKTIAEAAIALGIVAALALLYFGFAWYFIALCVLVAGCGSVCHEKLIEIAERRKQAAINDRPHTSEFTNNFSSDDRLIAQELRKLLERYPSVNWEKTRASDRLREDLGLNEADIAFILLELSRKFGIQLPMKIAQVCSLEGLIGKIRREIEK